MRLRDMCVSVDRPRFTTQPRRAAPTRAVKVDEAHGYNSLATASNIRDARIEGSKRASDLHMKLEWLRERHGPACSDDGDCDPDR
jgi:hypothetical protein